MTWLSDEAVSRLREVAERPDLTGTRYDLARELGRGGMGIVYEVHDRELGRSVAMKVIDEEWRSEARIIAALEHPGIVPVHDAGELPDGRAYYTMKLVRGARLDRWVVEGHSLTERLRLFVRVCEPMAFAHAQGVVHRDLKPQNVMVGEFGAVLVLDWGVGAIAGTPGFMPPEASRNARSDVYALGAILAFLMEGHSPSRALRAIAARAMNDDPESRYAHAGEMANDVLRFLDGEPVIAYTENVFERSARWMTRHQALLAMLVAYLIMRALILLF